MDLVTGEQIAGFMDTNDGILRSYYTTTEVFHQSTYGVVRPSSITTVYDCTLDANEQDWANVYWRTINDRCRSLFDADTNVDSSLKPASSVFKHACLY